MSIGVTPKIEWEAGFANTINFGYPLDFAVAFSMPREGSEKVQLHSGIEVAWTIGTDYMLNSQVRWIPTTDGTTQFGSQTGWDGATGWEAFLIWAMDGNSFRFFPDDTSGTFIDSYLVENPTPTLEPADGTRNVQLSIRSFSSSYAGY